MPRFKSKCLFCRDNNVINWKHVGCSGEKGENIDKYGYIECNDCHKKIKLINQKFYCSTNSEYRTITSRRQIRSLIALIEKIDGINDDFLDELEENLITEWDRTH